MFGEVEMLEKTTISTDEKTRIILPKFTKAEVGENLLVVGYENYYEIMSKDKMLSILKNFYNPEIVINPNMKNEIFEYYIDIILKEITVKNQCRISMSGILEPNRTYRVVGVLSNLRIYKDCKEKRR